MERLRGFPPGYPLGGHRKFLCRCLSFILLTECKREDNLAEKLARNKTNLIPQHERAAAGILLEEGKLAWTLPSEGRKTKDKRTQKPRASNPQPPAPSPSPEPQCPKPQAPSPKPQLQTPSLQPQPMTLTPIPSLQSQFTVLSSVLGLYPLAPKPQSPASSSQQSPAPKPWATSLQSSAPSPTPSCKFQTPESGTRSSVKDLHDSESMMELYEALSILQGNESQLYEAPILTSPEETGALPQSFQNSEIPSVASLPFGR